MDMQHSDSIERRPLDDLAVGLSKEPQFGDLSAKSYRQLFFVVEELKRFPGAETDPFVKEVLNFFKANSDAQQYILCNAWLSCSKKAQEVFSSYQIEEVRDPLAVFESAGEAAFALDLIKCEPLVFEILLDDLRGDSGVTPEIVAKAWHILTEKLSAPNSFLHTLLNSVLEQTANLSQAKMLRGYLSGFLDLCARHPPHGFVEVVNRIFDIFVEQLPVEFKLLFSDVTLPVQKRFLREILNSANQGSSALAKEEVSETLKDEAEQLAAVTIICGASTAEAQLDALEDFLEKLKRAEIPLTIGCAIKIANSIKSNVGWGRKDLGRMEMYEAMSKQGQNRWAPNKFEPIDRIVLWHVCNLLESVDSLEKLEKLQQLVFRKLEETFEWKTLKADFRHEFGSFLATLLSSKYHTGRGETGGVSGDAHVSES